MPFGASIVSPDRETRSSLLPACDSPSVTPAVSQENLDASGATTRTPQPSSTATTPPPVARLAEKDLEACTSTLHADADDAGEASAPYQHPFTCKVSVDCNKEDRMWPSKQTLLQRRQADQKRKRAKKTCGGCTGPVVERWQALSKRQRLAIQLIMAVLLLGAVVGIAVGITVSVNGTVYVGSDESRRIPEPEPVNLK